MKNPNNKKLFIIALFVIFGLFSISLLAQEKENEFQNKIDQLKGKIEKVTIKVDGIDVIFEGDDAVKIVKNISTFSKIPLLWSVDENDFVSNDKVNIIKHRLRKDDAFEWKDKDGDKKKVEVQIEDGKKKVTITTEKDGKEETKILEGEEAAKYLEENETDTHSTFIEMGGIDKDNVFIFKRLGDKFSSHCCCHKRIKHLDSIDGKGIKKIIIKERKKEIDNK